MNIRVDEMFIINLVGGAGARVISNKDKKDDDCNRVTQRIKVQEWGVPNDRDWKNWNRGTTHADGIGCVRGEAMRSEVSEDSWRVKLRQPTR